MATASKLSSGERGVIVEALDLQLKSLQRAERAAKDAGISAAYAAAANNVQALLAKVRSQELEL